MIIASCALVNCHSLIHRDSSSSKSMSSTSSTRPGDSFSSRVVLDGISLLAKRKGARFISLYSSLFFLSIEILSARLLRRFKYLSGFRKVEDILAGSLTKICATSSLVGSCLEPHFSKKAFASCPKSTKLNISPYVSLSPRKQLFGEKCFNGIDFSRIGEAGVGDF